MVGYRENQFYNFPVASRASRDNPPFMFPGKSARTLDGVNGVKQVQRGFIKSLIGDSSTSIPYIDSNSSASELFKKRMFFQFNPQNIVQNVSMNENAANPLLQDAGQFTQPVPGNSNFNFEILLDRQMEMNGPKSRSINPNDPASVRNGMEDRDRSLHIDRATDPADIGVFADLKILFQVIGQGLSKEQLDVYRSLAERSSAGALDASDKSAADAAAPTAVPFASGDDLNINAGNNAFIAPLPVRVVFSSLFMVDGFVTNTNVFFTKFNANMVPTQCRVGISMQAMYLGFARERTVLNLALEMAQLPTSSSGGASSPPNTVSSGGDPKDVATLNTFANTILKTFFIQVSGQENNPPGEQGSFSGIKVNILGDSELSAYYGFTNSARTGSDAIYAYLGRDKMSISYDFTLTVSRKGLPVEAPPGEPLSNGYTTNYVVPLMRIRGSSQYALGSKNDRRDGVIKPDTSAVAQNQTQWDSIRRVRHRKISVANQTLEYPPKAEGFTQGFDGSDLFMSKTVGGVMGEGDKYVAAGLKLEVVVELNVHVELDGGDKLPTKATFSRKGTSAHRQLVAPNSYLGVEFSVKPRFGGSGQVKVS
jgi:hypothetical protein